MSMTPMDVSHQRFRKTLFGFDASEVETYLELVSNELNALTRERQMLEDENEELKALVDEYREREKALKETMLAAQRVADEMKMTAQREAELIIARAELSAERLLEEAQKRQTKILLEINDLKRRKIQMVMEIKGALHTHLELLKAHDDVESIKHARLLPEEESTDVGEEANSTF